MVKIRAPCWANKYASILTSIKNVQLCICNYAFCIFSTPLDGQLEWLKLSDISSQKLYGTYPSSQAGGCLEVLMTQNCRICSFTFGTIITLFCIQFCKAADTLKFWWRRIVLFAHFLSAQIFTPLFLSRIQFCKACVYRSLSRMPWNLNNADLSYFLTSLVHWVVTMTFGIMIFYCVQDGTNTFHIIWWMIKISNYIACSLWMCSELECRLHPVDGQGLKYIFFFYLKIPMVRIQVWEVWRMSWGLDDVKLSYLPNSLCNVHWWHLNSCVAARAVWLNHCSSQFDEMYVPNVVVQSNVRSQSRSVPIWPSVGIVITVWKRWYSDIGLGTFPMQDIVHRSKIFRQKANTPRQCWSSMYVVRVVVCQSNYQWSWLYLPTTLSSVSNSNNDFEEEKNFLGTLHNMFRIVQVITFDLLRFSWKLWKKRSVRILIYVCN